MYFMPPHARLEEFWLVKLAKSPRSINATEAPCDDNEAAETAPLMPDPMISVSKIVVGSLSKFVVRRLKPFAPVVIADCRKRNLQTQYVKVTFVTKNS